MAFAMKESFISDLDEIERETAPHVPAEEVEGVFFGSSEPNLLQGYENLRIGRLVLRNFGHFLTNYKYNSETITANCESFNYAVRCFFHNERIAESTEIIEMSYCESSALTKEIITIGSVMYELVILQAESKRYLQFFIHIKDKMGSESTHGVDRFKEIYEQVQLTRSFVERTHKVIFQVFDGVLRMLRSYHMHYTKCQFPDVWTTLSRTLAGLIILDHVCDHSSIKNGLIAFHKAYCCAGQQTGTKSEQKRSFHIMDKQIQELYDVTKPNKFRNAFLFEQKLFPELKSNTVRRELTTFLQDTITKFEENVEMLLTASLEFIELLGMVGAFQLLFQEIPQSIHKRLADISKNIWPIYFADDYVFCCEHFLAEYVPQVAQILDYAYIERTRRIRVPAKIRESSGNIRKLGRELTLLMSDYESCMYVELAEIGDERLLVGYDKLKMIVKYLRKISDTAKFLTRHGPNMDDITTTSVQCVFRCLEISKVIEYFFIKNWYVILYTLIMLERYYSAMALAEVNELIEKSFYFDRENKSLLRTALEVARNNINCPTSTKRLVIIYTAMSLPDHQQEPLKRFYEIMADLRGIFEFFNTLTLALETGYMQWHENYMLPIYLGRALDPMMDFNRYYLILKALDRRDIIPGQVDNSAFLATTIKHKLLYPLERYINFELRSQLSDMNEIMEHYKIGRPVLLEQAALGQIRDHYYCLRKQIEHYLNSNFYNMVGMQIHDCSVYTNLRELVAIQKGILLADDDLPALTVQQGLDVLLIMRNIHVFVNHHLYDMGTQTFVEIASSSKHLNTITIGQVASSIRTHGYGILNTTINYSYQFLMTKFWHFSQFLFDELIKSRLMKEITWFNDSQLPMYPHDRAVAFSKYMRECGGVSKDVSYLDKFRLLIRQIGNTLGFVRMIQSALAPARASVGARRAADEHYKTVRSTTDSYAACAEYFRLMIATLKPVFRNEMHWHLRSFHIALPALIVSHVAHAHAGRESVARGGAAAAFADDGFALGAAFMVELLGQGAEFARLNWERAVAQHVAEEMRRAKGDAVRGDMEPGYLSSCRLTQKRVQAFKTEYELFMNNYKSAATFFVEFV